MRSWIVGALVLAGLTGCTQPAIRSAEDRAEQQPPVRAVAQRPQAGPLRLTFDDLAESIPMGAELKPWTLRKKCVARAMTCADDGKSQGSAVALERRESADMHETLVVAATLWPTARAARRDLGKAYRGGTAIIDGHFDVDPVDTEDGFTFGMIGHGDVAAFEVGAWRGYRSTASLRYVHQDGRRSQRTRYLEVAVARDRVSVHVTIRTFVDLAGVPAEQQVSRLVTDLVAELEARGAQPSATTTAEAMPAS